MKRKETFWFFYPITGLDIIGADQNLKNFIFRDASIFSRKVSIKVFEENLSEHNKKNWHADKVFASLEALYEGEKFYSCIIVKRSWLFSEKYDENKRKGLGDVVVGSLERSFQIADLLSLVFLYESEGGAFSPQTCGLTGYSSLNHYGFLGLEIHSGKLIKQAVFEQPNVVCTLTPIKIGILDLLKILKKKRYYGLANIIGFKEKRIGIKQRNIIIQASRRLCEVLYVTDLSQKLIGSFISMELLLSLDGYTPYSKMKSRLKTLVGDRAYEYCKAEKVFEARNNYIHRGNRIERRDIPNYAICLALLALCNFSNLALYFPTKEKLIYYLEFMNDASHLRDIWSKSQKEAINEIMIYNFDESELPLWIKD